MAWISRVWDAHPELVVTVTDTPPPVGYNRIRMLTGDNGGGVTNISFDSSAHLLAATITLDDGVGQGSDTAAKDIVYHEFCHALGGGFTPPGGVDIHHLCNREYHQLNWQRVAEVYHNDLG